MPGGYRAGASALTAHHDQAEQRLGVGRIEGAVDEGRAGLRASDDVVGRGVYGRGCSRHDRDLVEHGGECALVGDEERPHPCVGRGNRCANLCVAVRFTVRVDGCACSLSCARRRGRGHGWIPPGDQAQARGSSFGGVPPLSGHPCREAGQRAVHTSEVMPRRRDLTTWRWKRLHNPLNSPIACGRQRADR
jgi:hypothetical protein